MRRFTSGIAYPPTMPIKLDFVAAPATIPERYEGSWIQLSKTEKFGATGVKDEPIKKAVSG